MKIKLNILDAEFDTRTLDSLFGVLIMKCKNRKRVWASTALDFFGDDSSCVKAVCYREEYIYFLAGQDCGGSVKKKLASLEGEETGYASLEFVSCSELLRRGRKSVLVQLLLNSVPAVGGDPLCDAANLTGRLLCHHSAWKAKDGFGNPLYVTMEIRVDKDMHIDLPIITFSRTERNTDYEGKPFYQLEKNGSMKRIFVPSKTVYVIRRFDDGRSEVPFLLLKDESVFSRCKVGVLCRMLERFERIHGQYCRLSFREAENEVIPQVDDAIRMLKKNNNCIVGNWVKNHRGIAVKDMIGTAESATVTQALQKMLGELYSPKGECELHLVHERKWYLDRNVDDPYSSPSGIGVQHIALETLVLAGELLPSVPAVLENCISNLIVKDDLCSGQMSLGTALLDKNARYAFGMVIDPPEIDDEQPDNNDKMVLFMEISGGRVSVKKGAVGSAEVLFDDDLLSVESFWKNDFRGLIFKGKSVMAICDTNLFTVPELWQIKEELERNSRDTAYLAKNKISRDEESRNRFFYAVTDINVFRTDVREGRCYNVGVIGKGMNAKIQRASRIREISLLRGEDFSDEIIPMMTELHVRNGQMSVLPFPFKYLRESLTIG